MKRLKYAPLALLCALVFAWAMMRPITETASNRGDPTAQISGFLKLAQTPQPRPTAQPTATEKPKIMADEIAKIARGTTKEGDLYQTAGGDNEQGTWLVYFSARPIGGSIVAANPENTSYPPTDWVVSSGGLITVPEIAAQGIYSAEYWVGPSSVNYYEFEVVCMTVAIDVQYNPDSDLVTVTAQTQGGTAPFDPYNWTLPSDALFVTGTGNTRTFRVPIDRNDSVSVTVSDADTPTPCTATATQPFYFASTVTCPAGSHDDGNGNCVPDNPTDPQPCADGYTWNGTACVPDEPTEPGACTLDGFVGFTDKGNNLYRVEMVTTGAQGAVSYVWKRDGSTISQTGAAFDATIALSNSALFQCDATDGAGCSIMRRGRESNDDEGTTGPTDPTLPATPNAPTAAKVCASGVIRVTAPALPSGATSLEIARDDAPETSIATATFDDSDAGTLPRKYRARGVNAQGAGAWGTYSNAVSLVSSALTIAWNAPADGATLGDDSELRFTVTDSGETLNDCGLPRLPDGACAGLSVDDAQISFMLGGYALPIVATLVSGTPRNGAYRALFDARDYSDGARTLTVKARGSDCCFGFASRAVVVSNTLQSAVKYRDIQAQSPQGQVVPDAGYQITTLALNENPTRNYWLEHGARSGTALDDDYSDEAWDAHQKLTLTQTQHWPAQGTRPETTQYRAPVQFLLPLQREVRVRRKYTPQFALGCFDTVSGVAKIRQIEAGKHLVWTRDEARVYIYDGQSLAPIFVGSAFDAGAATDAALLGDKLFVATPDELFAFDLDAGDVAMNYTVRGEAGVPTFVENVAGTVVALYVSGGQTRAYSLAFGAPRLLWTLPVVVTRANVSGGKLLIAAGTTFYVSSDGKTLPALDHDFAVTITSLGEKYLGFGNGDVREKVGGVWQLALARGGGAIGGAVDWRGGTGGESSEAPARATLGGAGHWLTSRRASGAWFDERELVTPLDLAPRDEGNVTALELFAVESKRTIKNGDEEIEQTTTDERLLVGTSTGLLFVYGRSLLFPGDNVIPVNRDYAAALFPFGQFA